MKPIRHPIFQVASEVWGFVVLYTIMKKLLDEENRIMQVMAEKHKEIYFEMFGTLILNGMDIRTAIWECWNKLECGGKNG